MSVIRNRMGACLMSLCLIVAVLLPTVDVHADRQDTISEVERVLKQAATESQDRHTDPASTDRAIQDITYFIEQSWKAAEKSNHAARKDHAKQAKALLLRSMRIGDFDLAKASPILMLIEGLLSDQPG